MNRLEGKLRWEGCQGVSTAEVETDLESVEVPLEVTVVVLVKHQ